MENISPPSRRTPSQQQDALQAKSMTSTEAEAPFYSSALHSVQKPSPKPWKKPEQLRATKVYNVNPQDFRDLVQQLTGASSPSSDVVARKSLTSSHPTSTALKHGVTNNIGYSAASSAMHEETLKADRRAMSHLESPKVFMDILSPSSYLPGWWQLQSP